MPGAPQFNEYLQVLLPSAPNVFDSNSPDSFIGTLQAGVGYNLWIATRLDSYHSDLPSEALGSFSFTITPVPEPSTLLLLALGGIGLAIAAYQRRRMAAI